MSLGGLGRLLQHEQLLLRQGWQAMLLCAWRHRQPSRRRSRVCWQLMLLQSNAKNHKLAAEQRLRCMPSASTCWEA